MRAAASLLSRMLAWRQLAVSRAKGPSGTACVGPAQHRCHAAPAHRTDAPRPARPPALAASQRWRSNARCWCTTTRAAAVPPLSSSEWQLAPPWPAQPFRRPKLRNIRPLPHCALRCADQSVGCAASPCDSSHIQPVSSAPLSARSMCRAPGPNWPGVWQWPLLRAGHGSLPFAPLAVGFFGTHSELGIPPRAYGRAWPARPGASFVQRAQRTERAALRGGAVVA